MVMMIVLQELKPKPGDVRAHVLQTMLLVATKNKAHVEKAINIFMEICNNEVTFTIKFMLNLTT